MTQSSGSRASQGYGAKRKLGGRSRVEIGRWEKALIFLAPAILLYFIFVVRPTVEVFRLSFTSWNGISATKPWIGLDNYRELLTDKLFWQSFRNTVIWATIIVVINVFIGLILAALLAQPIRGRVYYQLAHFLPVIQAPIVTAVIWRWMYQPKGAINTFLHTIGLGSLAKGWLGDFHWALPALAIASAWQGLGLSIVIFLGGLQNIDPSLYEAAELDGANRVQSFWHITRPGLEQVTTMVLMLVITGAFKAFDLVWATTQGGPVRATELLATYMYKRGMLETRYGYGCTVAVFLMITVTAFSALYMKRQQMKELE
jgi:raffinose/stachyose/melibiose transport system permease protein